MDIFKDKRSRFHPIFSSYSKNFGFTLIVLLLLLAVIGILISYQVTTMQQKEQEQKVEKTALQIQAILEAGFAYSIGNHHWPDYPPKENDFTPYLPFNRLFTNPFGHEYYYSVVDKNFQVETAVPNEAVARQIAALLPNGKVVKKSDTTFIVIATVGGKVDSKIFISSIKWQSLTAADFSGTQGELTRNTSFYCPDGYAGKLLVFPYYYVIGSRIYTGVTPAVKAIGMKSEVSSCKISGTNTTSCSYTFVFKGQICNAYDKEGWWKSGSVCNDVSEVPLTGPAALEGTPGMLVMNADGNVTILEVGYCER